MGSWGITMRESDYGLDLLGTIIGSQLKALDFSNFTVADALEVIKADIMEEIRQAKTELARAKEKANGWQARVRDLEKQITECENAEILQAVRSIATSPEELRGLLDMLRASKEPPQTGSDNTEN